MKCKYTGVSINKIGGKGSELKANISCRLLQLLRTLLPPLSMRLFFVAYRLVSAVAIAMADLPLRCLFTFLLRCVFIAYIFSVVLPLGYSLVRTYKKKEAGQLARSHDTVVCGQQADAFDLHLVYSYFSLRSNPHTRKSSCNRSVEIVCEVLEVN